MMIFRKVIPRRTFIRGLGGSIALPLLDSMVPALAKATTPQVPLRLGTVYVPNGMWPMDKWTPKEEGTEFTLTPTLEPLSKFRDRLLILTGLAHPEATPKDNDGGLNHGRAFATYLTGARPKFTAGKDFRVGISMDQIAANKIGAETQLASLEVALFPNELVGACEAGATCTYVNTLSWRTPTTPMPMETNPRAVFERLFGDSDTTDRSERLARIHDQRSVLDWAGEAMSRLITGIGTSDRAKLDEYLEAIRDTERRIQVAEKDANQDVPPFERPDGVPTSFEQYAKLMIDLQILAYQADLTRIITFAMGREGPFGSRPFPEIGIPDLHHSISHHQGSAEAIEKLFQINVYHTEIFAYFLDKMRSVPEADGSLLDHTILQYGSGLADGNIHQHDNLPTLLVGGGVKGGRHVRYPDWTPMTNLHLAMLHKIGVPIDNFGDSTGELNVLDV